MASLNGIGKTDAYMWRYDSTLLAKVLWDGGGGGAAGSTQVSVSTGNVQTLPQSTVWAGNAGFHFDASGNLNVAGGAGGSSQVTISRVQDGADNPVFIGDSTNNAVRVNVVAGAAGGSTTVQVSSVGGVVSVSPNSTVWAVQLSQYSTTAQVSSVGGVVTVQQNSTTWAVQLTQWSTTHNVSSLAGTVATRPTPASTQTFATVQVSNTVGTLLAANAARLGATICNQSVNPLFVRYGPSASTSAYSVKMSSNASYLEVPFGYTGIITGLVETSTGRCQVTEFAA